MAVSNRRPQVGVIHHSDHGAQYASLAFTKRLREVGIVGSMGTVGDAYDNVLRHSPDGAPRPGSVAVLLAAYGLSADRVVQHHRWNSKECPHILRHRPGGWEGFLRAVKVELESLKKGGN